MTDDLDQHGLVDFSLRRAAAAAGTIHKVLLYHFDSVEELMRQALLELRGDECGPRRPRRANPPTGHSPSASDRSGAP